MALRRRYLEIALCINANNSKL